MNKKKPTSFLSISLIEEGKTIFKTKCKTNSIKAFTANSFLNSDIMRDKDKRLFMIDKDVAEILENKL